MQRLIEVQNGRRNKVCGIEIHPEEIAVILLDIVFQLILIQYLIVIKEGTGCHISCQHAAEDHLGNHHKQYRLLFSLLKQEKIKNGKNRTAYQGNHVEFITGQIDLPDRLGSA